MDEYRKYRRTQIAELADWHPDFDMSGVSVSEADRQNGSPKEGDKIAQNPANHSDRWLVSAEYAATNFEPVDQAAFSRSVVGVEEIHREIIAQIDEVQQRRGDCWLSTSDEVALAERIHALSRVQRDRESDWMTATCGCWYRRGCIAHTRRHFCRTGG